NVKENEIVEQITVKALIPKEIISTRGTDIGQTPYVNHQIPLKLGVRPIAHPPYRLNQERKDFLEKEIDKMLETGIIQTSESPWASPVVIVPKKTGDLRIC
ncbi:1055_t:CDS:1, partial [Funneliformis geosporum]